MRISDWSSDVCSSDLYVQLVLDKYPLSDRMLPDNIRESSNRECSQSIRLVQFLPQRLNRCMEQARAMLDPLQPLDCARILTNVQLGAVHLENYPSHHLLNSSEEHTSEHKSLLHTSYAVFSCKKTT